MTRARLRTVTGDKLSLRWSQIDGLELRCPWCGEWWALDSEFWTMNYWDKCTACRRERSRLWQAMRRTDPAFREYEIEKNRRYRASIRRMYPDLLAAYDRERRAQKRVWLRNKRDAANQAKAA